MRDGLRIALVRAYQSAVVNAAREHGTTLDPDDFLKTLTNLPDEVRERLLASYREQINELSHDPGEADGGARAGARRPG